MVCVVGLFQAGATVTTALFPPWFPPNRAGGSAGNSSWAGRRVVEVDDADVEDVEGDGRCVWIEGAADALVVVDKGVDCVVDDADLVGVDVVVVSVFPKKLRIPLKKPRFVVVDSGAGVVEVVLGCW